jgi:GTPase
LSDKNVDLEFEALLRASAQVAADYDSNLLADISTPDQVAERAALRRIAGFSTQLQDISDAEYRELQLEKVVLVGVWTEGTSEMAENSLAELKALSETAGAEVLEGVIQRRESPDPATYIGSGKVQELRDIVV